MSFIQHNVTHGHLGAEPTTAIVDDLAAIVRQLAHALHNSQPNNDLPERALDYLRRKGLQGSPLRKGSNSSRIEYPSHEIKMENIIEFNQKEKKEPVCAFCKKPKSKVPLLISDEGKPCICSNCVEKCNKLLVEHDA